jgi:hypothetical protein
MSVCLLGRQQSTASSLQAHPSLGGIQQTAAAAARPSDDLWQQIRDQKEFQALIQKNQKPSASCSGKLRYLIRDEIPPKDGFASEVQYIARLLQVAVSTKRILWITESWKSAYCPQDEQHTLSGWSCLWQPMTNCTLDSTGRPTRKATGDRGKNRTLLDTALSPLNYGILPQRKRSTETSPWFDPLLYSSRPMLPAPISFPLKHSAVIADVVPYWERAYGRYWIRSQMVHYLWKPASWLQEEIRRRLIDIYPVDRPFIGLHVRYTDNIPDLSKGFGRNATYTRQLSHFSGLATDIAKRHKALTGVELRDVYIATDHAQVLSWARTLFVGWHVWGQDGSDVQRSTTQNRIWFARGRSSAAGAMAADLEVLRRSDYLIGSFQSNVYRLASQLNTAWHIDRYSVHALRHFTVDVEWFEDP